MWDILETISNSFITPLRSLLSENRAWCRNELQAKRDETETAKQGGSRSKPKVTVEVPDDGRLPAPSLQDEIEVG